MPHLKISNLLVASLFLFGCMNQEKPAVSSDGDAYGVISMRVAVDVGSPFKSIVKSGTVTISAKDMENKIADMTLEDSAITAKIVGVPVGKSRLVEIQAFDSAGTLRYHGSTTVDVAADSTSNAAVTLIRTTGTVVVTGKVVEGDSTPVTGGTPLPTPVRFTLGAQGSTVGGVLDLDTKSVWTSAMANANQAEIDLVFLFYNSVFRLDNAANAKSAGVAYNINMTNNYDDALIKSPLLIKIDSLPASQETALTAYRSGWSSQGVYAGPDVYFMIKSTQGTMVLIAVRELVGVDRTGAVTLDVYYLDLPLI